MNWQVQQLLTEIAAVRVQGVEARAGIPGAAVRHYLTEFVPSAVDVTRWGRSLPGAFLGSLLIGLVQTFAVSMNGSLSELFGPLGPDYAASWLADIWNVTIAQIAPIMPYLLLVLILVFRPMGLLGTRDT